MGFRFIWYGEGVHAEIDAIVSARIDKAASLLEAKVKHRLSRVSPVPSAPGESPRMVTGQLRDSVVRQVDQQTMTFRVGTNLERGRHLEVGTRKMEARPWLAPTIEEAEAELAETLTTI